MVDALVLLLSPVFRPVDLAVVRLRTGRFGNDDPFGLELGLLPAQQTREPAPRSSLGASYFNDALCIHGLALRCERRERSLHRR